MTTWPTAAVLLMVAVVGAGGSLGACGVCCACVSAVCGLPICGAGTPGRSSDAVAMCVCTMGRQFATRRALLPLSPGLRWDPGRRTCSAF